MSSNLQKLLDKEIDRKQFMSYLGAGILSVVGMGGLVKSLLDLNSKPSGSLYGKAKYGKK